MKKFKNKENISDNAENPKSGISDVSKRYIAKKYLYLIKTNMKYENKIKKFDVKLESIDPTGVVENLILNIYI